MSYKNRLESLKKNWETDKADSGAGSQLPAGKYQFEIKRALLGESKASFNKGHLQVELYLSVVTGPLKGRKHIIRQDLEAPVNKEKGWPSGISRFKAILEKLEIDMPKRLDQPTIEKTLAQLVSVVFNGQCVHNEKGWANVYINDLVNAGGDADEDEDVTEDDASEDDEDTEDADDVTEDDDETTTDEDDDEEEKPAPKPKPSTSSGKKPPAKPAAKPKAESEDDDWEKEFEK